MYDIKPLEAEWKKYRKKRQKPWYIGGFIFLILFILGVTFFGNIKINMETFTSYFKTFKSNAFPVGKEVKSTVLLDNALETLDIEKSILTEIVKVKSESSNIQILDESKSKSPNILVDIPILEDVKQPDKVKLPEERREKVHIEIIETSSITAYKDVEKRFLQSHDIDDSLFLAKSYYKKGYYEKAEYWALETNKINDNIEDSLLIFVKSKVKLGYKNEAISILTKYISKSNSQAARNLLFKIKNDTL